MTDKDWAYWDDGVEFILKTLGCSRGKAQKVMKTAVESGEVRLWRHEGLIRPVRSRAADVRETIFSISDFRCWFNEHYPAARKSKKGGGAPAKADWPAIYEAIRREITERGRPDRLNVKGWNCQADIERRILDLARRDRTPVSEPTARTHARRILSKKGS